MLLGSSQMRFAHTDVSFPDFTTYRRDSVKDASADSEASAPSRKAFTYLMVAGICLLTVLNVSVSSIQWLVYTHAFFYYYSTLLLICLFSVALNQDGDSLQLASTACQWQHYKCAQISNSTD